jgi:hypothetical protein
MNLLTPGTSSYRETCLTPCHDGNEVIKVKIEDVTDVEVGDDPLFVEVGDDPLSVEVGDDPLSVTFPVTKTEHKVSCMTAYIARHILHISKLLLVLLILSVHMT